MGPHARRPVGGSAPLLSLVRADLEARHARQVRAVYQAGDARNRTRRGVGPRSAHDAGRRGTRARAAHNTRRDGESTGAALNDSRTIAFPHKRHPNLTPYSTRKELTNDAFRAPTNPVSQPAGFVCPCLSHASLSARIYGRPHVTLNTAGAGQRLDSR